MQCSVCQSHTDIVLRHEGTHQVLAVCSELCSIQATGQMLPIAASVADAYMAASSAERAIARIGDPRMKANKTPRVKRGMRATAASPQFRQALGQMIKLLGFARKHGVDAAKLLPARKPKSGKRDKFESLVRVALNKVGVMIVSAGEAGADATLGVGSFGLPTEKIADVIFVAFDTMVAMASSAQAVGSLLKSVRGTINAKGALLDSFGAGGPREVARQMNMLMSSLGTKSAVREFANRAREVYIKIVDWLGNMVSGAIEAVAGAFGVARITVNGFVQTALLLVKNKPYTYMAKLFESLPAAARELLTSKAKMEGAVHGVINILLKMFPVRDASKRDRMVAALKRGAASTVVALPLLVFPVTSAPTMAALFLGNMGFATVPQATEWVHHRIEDTLAPNAERIASAVQQSMSLMFALLYVLEHGGADVPVDALPVATKAELAEMPATLPGLKVPAEQSASSDDEAVSESASTMSEQSVSGDESDVMTPSGSRSGSESDLSASDSGSGSE